MLQACFGLVRFASVLCIVSHKYNEYWWNIQSTGVNCTYETLNCTGKRSTEKGQVDSRTALQFLTSGYATDMVTCLD